MKTSSRFVPDDYFDPIIHSLLFGNYTEISEFNDTEDEELKNGNELKFFDGIWGCGNCDNITERELTYQEVYDVYTEDGYDSSFEIQVGLSLDKMECVVVQSDENFTMKRISGLCTGPNLTLKVDEAQHFTVSVYGDYKRT
ncbi:unnamed protein product [Parnassius apollo]|uniref:(apollo) hypothetical protein n=1 Tax=Parnassius apollo TaxID=110799 RepID=A0A8S3X4W0_PARAO|nr:unnamed protein product [Parnassius apollo]